MEKLYYAKVEIPIELYNRKDHTIDDIKSELGFRLMNKIRDNLVVSEEMRSNCDKVTYTTKIRVDFCDTDYSSWENSTEGR